MERLTVRVKEGDRKGECFIPGNKGTIEKVEYIRENGRWESEEYKGKAIDKLAEYEDLDEQGKLLKLPCKIGGTVYVIMNQRDNFSDALYKIATAAFFRYDMIKDVGKTVFLTREEAEEALENLPGL